MVGPATSHPETDEVVKMFVKSLLHGGKLFDLDKIVGLLVIDGLPFKEVQSEPFQWWKQGIFQKWIL